MNWEPIMSVAELKAQLSKLPADAKVVVHWEVDSQFFEIDEVSLHKGTPSRIEGKAAFSFENSGPASWVFISLSAAQPLGCPTFAPQIVADMPGLPLFGPLHSL